MPALPQLNGKKIDWVHVWMLTSTSECIWILLRICHNWVNVLLRLRPVDSDRVELDIGEIRKYFGGAPWLVCVVGPNKKMWCIHWKRDGNSGVFCSHRR